MFPDSASPDLVPSNIAKTITEDFLCTRCGYNLRGLTLDRLCPECAAPVARSIHGRLLKYADPDWMDRLRLGTVLMLWNLLIGLVTGVAFGILTSVGVPQAVAGVLTLIASALGLWATFLVTMPEPAVALEEDPFALRRVVRVCAAVNFLQQVLGQSQLVTGPWMLSLSAGMALAGLAAHFGLCVYFRRFARRIPDERLAKNTTTVMWGYGASLALMVAGALLALTVVGTMPAAGAPPALATSAIAGLVAVFCPGILGSLVFGIWYVVLLFRYHAAFKMAAAEARATIDTGSMPPGSVSEGGPLEARTTPNA